MKSITNKEYEEWQKYKAEKVKGHILMPDTTGSSARPTAMMQRRSASISLKSCGRSVQKKNEEYI